MFAVQEYSRHDCFCTLGLLLLFCLPYTHFCVTRISRCVIRLYCEPVVYCATKNNFIINPCYQNLWTRGFQSNLIQHHNCVRSASPHVQGRNLKYDNTSASDVPCREQMQSSCVSKSYLLNCTRVHPYTQKEPLREMCVSFAFTNGIANIQK